MKISYRQAASDDVVRQFRYYLVNSDLPDLATRFREAVKRTMHFLSQNPEVGSHYGVSNFEFQNLRSWPVTGFEAIRTYYSVGKDKMHVIRILHSKRDVQRILRREKT